MLYSNDQAGRIKVLIDAVELYNNATGKHYKMSYNCTSDEVVIEDDAVCFRFSVATDSPGAALRDFFRAIVK